MSLVSVLRKTLVLRRIEQPEKLVRGRRVGDRHPENLQLIGHLVSEILILSVLFF